MSKKIEKIFDKCINLIEKGYSTEYCLERYSGYREELEEYFAVAKELGKMEEVKPDSRYIKSSLDKIYASSAEALQTVKTIWIISTIRKNMGSKMATTIKIQNS